MQLKPFKLERFFEQHEFSAPYLLCASDCESMTLQDLLALEPGAAQRFESLWLGYTETLGAPELRQAISTTYDHLLNDHILVHAGAEEAIFNFMNIAVSPGDQVIVQAPFYQSLGEIARGIGAEVSEWQGNPAKGWELDIDHLKSILTGRTKVVVVNFPHNPTGFLPTHGFAQELSDLSEKEGFIIFSDEVYRGLELDPFDRLPSFAEINERAVALGVMSKTYGLAGLRIGWVATQNRALFEKLATFKDYTTICSSAPSEFLATLALQNAKVIVERNLKIIRNNLDHLDTFFDSHTDLFAWYRPKAGSVVLPRLLQGSVDQLCADLIAKAGVLLMPGTLFQEGLNAFRVGFGRKDLPDALERFETYLQENK